MIHELSIFSDLFWLFFTLATSVLMLWISIAFRHLRTSASRALLISAVLDIPCSLFNAFYWNVWPYGFAGIDLLNDSEPFEVLETVTSNFSTLLFSIWLIALLFVALRSKKEHARITDLQQILEQKIQSEGPAPEPPAADQ